ncbi:hypothetical protein [Hyalangium sp.]|uniref:hypothetical protein n=1 Tax=Hyalangium sp. TaxID=2028555 RepID=UPI002D283603|nr:hypothetical protein [Hyalangium sp.]HYH95839.1 hypothetical protein [Hyalangium sp.]
MTPWLALSLGLWLGQTPEITPSLPPDAETQDPAALELREAWERALQNADATDEGQDFTDGTVQMPVLDVGGTAEADRSVSVPSTAATGSATDTQATGTGGAGTEGTSGEAQAPGAPPPVVSAAPTTGNPQRDVEQLRAQVQALQAQLQAQQEQDTVRAEALQQQLTGMRERAEELELMRQQRLAELERAGQWLLAVDQALAVGELDVGDALQEADAALAQVAQSATDAGSGQTVILVEGARGSIARALNSAGHRDTSSARWDLFYAAEQIREARRQNLDEASATTLTR